MQTPLTFAAWTSALTIRGYTVLPASHAVPVELWLRTPRGEVLHFRARGTRVVLRRYTATALAERLVQQCGRGAGQLLDRRNRRLWRPLLHPEYW